MSWLDDIGDTVNPKNWGPQTWGAVLGGPVGWLAGTGLESAGIGSIGDLTDPTTQQTVNEPWSAQQPYLKRGFGAAESLYFNPDGSLKTNIPGQSQQTINAINMMSRGMGSDPYLSSGYGSAANLAGGVMNPALPMLSYGAQGGFLNANPYLDQMFGQAAGNVSRQFQNTVLPGINSTFSLAGRTGSGAHQNVVGEAGRNVGDTLNNLATNIYGGNYANERNLMQQAQGQLGNQYLQGIGQQLNAIGMLPQLSQTMDARTLKNISLMGQAGTVQDEYNRMLANAPADALRNYMGAVTGNYGGTTTAPGPSALDRALNYIAQGATVAVPIMMGGRGGGGYMPNYGTEWQVQGDAVSPAYVR